MANQPAKNFTFFSLWNYQAELVGDIFNSFKTDRSTVAQIATAAGKTVIGAAVADRFVKQQGQVLWLAHREELLVQAYEKLQHVCVTPVGLIQSGSKIDDSLAIQVASVQTLSRRKKTLNFDLIITDECHHAISNTYQTIYNLYPDCYHLGLTATPKRLDGRGLDELFDHLVCGASPSWLIEHQYLSPYRLFAPTKTIETKGIRTVAGDFNVKKLKTAAMSADVMGEVVPTWQKHANGLKTAVFCCDIEHSMAVCELYRMAGVRAEHLDGDTPKTERRQTLKAFESGAITVLVNCGIISEGLDVPGIECVQILRPTQSLTLYLQMVGRALRKSADKLCAVILDHTKNWWEHGLPDDDRQWSLDGTIRHHRRNTEIDATTREVIVVTERNVSHDSTAQLTEISRQMIQSGEIATAAQQLQRLFADPIPEAGDTTDSSAYPWIDQLIAIQEYYDHKPGWVGYRVLETLKKNRDLDLKALEYVALQLGYSPLWAQHRLKEVQKAIESHTADTANSQLSVSEITPQLPPKLTLTQAEKLARLEEEPFGSSLTAQEFGFEGEQSILEVLFRANSLPTLVSGFLRFLQKDCSLSIVLTDHDKPLQVHLRLAKPLTFGKFWFKKVGESHSILQIELEKLLRHPVELNFAYCLQSHDCDASGTGKPARHCSRCNASTLEIKSGKPPHYAALECERGHFIAWLSKNDPIFTAPPSS
ncbi:DEAD/DEAH box helicase [Leptolyngbya sp. AN03gr2]|uniref:DEAD/DEAH box helicase n=1 Tax=unclassified Leptolyngbya TaxID=2650499 RepID=UPI003D31541B